MRRFLWTAVVLLLIAAMLAPAAEALDRWDSTPGLAGDSEFQIAALALVAGICAVVVLIALKRCSNFRLPLFAKITITVERLQSAVVAVIPADNSPPFHLPLRI